MLNRHRSSSRRVPVSHVATLRLGDGGERPSGGGPTRPPFSSAAVVSAARKLPRLLNNEREDGSLMKDDDARRLEVLSTEGRLFGNT